LTEGSINERKKDLLNDFDIEKDKKALSKDKMKDLNRWERFEKSFPFYRMDVNGFMKLINDARRIV